MRSLERTIADIASTDIPVLLVGESGTGKEVAALEIHRLSRHSAKPFVKCGCTGLTGEALSMRLQRVEEASKSDEGASGSLFLDGINHLDSAAQGRLLQLLPDDSAAPAHGCHYVRVISSTTKNLEDEMKSGRFREELYYRINGVQLRLPPLRDRKDDIPLLVEFFLKKYSSLFERPAPQISESTMNLLLRHNWPGNIRELENVTRKIVAMGDEHLAVHDLASRGDSKGPQEIPVAAAENPDSQIRTGSLKEAARAASRVAERAMILSQLERTRWNRKKAARELQISYQALLYKLKQLGLDTSDGPEGQ